MLRNCILQIPLNLSLAELLVQENPPLFGKRELPTLRHFTCGTPACPANLAIFSPWRHFYGRSPSPLQSGAEGGGEAEEMEDPMLILRRLLIM